MIDSTRERDPVEQLADEFASRCRSGEAPSVSEYATRYPQYADQIEELFPAVALMEQYRNQEQMRRRVEARAGNRGTIAEHFGDFRIVREIGRGAMGIVYEAEQKSLARRVALKVLPKHALLADKDRRRFQREARIAANLHHTNIVPVFGMGDHEGLYYYVMPLIRGVGLDEMIRELPRIDLEPDLGAVVKTLVTRKSTASTPSIRGDSWVAGSELVRSSPNHWMMVARIGVQAAEALDYAHRHGTLHRDVKPSNLLVDENGVVFVADFGLARAIDASDTRRPGEVVGTPRYVAPEQRSGQAEVRSDIYSLGLTLHECLTLRPALEVSSDGLCHAPALHHSELVPPSRYNPAVPRDLDVILLKCCASQPHERYSDAAALAEDLQRLLDCRPILARRITWPQLAARWCWRNPALAGVSTLAAVLLMTVGIIALVGHLGIRKAYRETAKALDRANATSLVALEALDDIFLQLSPDRVWVQSGIDAQGEVCVCLGLRSGGTPLSTVPKPATQLRASEEVATLLKGLLVFYDRLAEQVGNDEPVRLQSAIACRRVGDIRQLLGQLADAEREYIRAIERLSTIRSTGSGSTNRALELARSYNELGNVQSLRVELAAACNSHRLALATLQALGPVSQLPPEVQYEVAKTLYLLANKPAFVLGGRRGDVAVEAVSMPGGGSFRSHQYRETATGILERLVAKYPNLPDYQFLLALCLRPSGASLMTQADAANRRRAVAILQRLKEAHPEVLDYHHELASTYARIQVGLFPWQPPGFEPGAERSLGKALAESRFLVAHNPSIPHYACSEAIILAKLAQLRLRTGPPAEAERLFRQALQAQEGAIRRFPELPPHHHVLCEFMRVKLAQAILRQGHHAVDQHALERSRRQLEASIAGLTALADKPELAENRLVEASLSIAHQALNQVIQWQHVAREPRTVQ